MKRRMFNKSILFSSIAFGVAVMSTQINAGCLPATYGTAASPASDMGMGPIMPSRGSAMGCSDVKTVDVLQGGASSLIESIKDDIRAAGKEVKEQLKANSMAEIDMMTGSTEAMISTIVSTTDAQISDELKLKRSMLSMEMDYQAEFKEREIRAKNAPMDLDDTAEEVKFMLNELEKADTEHVQEVLADQYAKYGKDGKIIPVKIKAGESNTTKTGEKCPDYDPNKHFKAAGCFFGHKAFPAQKMAKYFDECSRAKRRIVSGAKKNAASAAVASTVQKSQNDFSNSSTQLKESLINSKIEKQAPINCNPYDFKKDYCLKELNGSKESYVQKVVANEIIPNGNISSNNLFKPTAVGSVDGDFSGSLTPEEKSAITSANIELDSKEGNAGVAVSDNTVPIVYTYRTSSQYLAAKDFVDNILSKEMVPNQSIDDRKKASNSVYQSRFLSRAAALSVAEVSLNKSIEARLGKKLRESIDNGDNFNPYVKIDGVAGKIVKEDINGAGYMDELADSINKDYEKVIIDGKNKIAGSAAAESLSSMSSKKPEEWQLEAIIKQNEVTLEQYHQGERIEALLSAILAQKANSPENIQYLEDLRRQ
jgi:hypothetical protein